MKILKKDVTPNDFANLIPNIHKISEFDNDEECEQNGFNFES